MKNFIALLGLISILSLCSVISNGQNYRFKQSMTVAGQEISSTVYVKGPRKRTEQGGIMGMGGDVANIEQCDMRRSIQLSDKKKLYIIEPFATDQNETAPVEKPAKAIPGKVTKGGTITMTTVINDTGERKQMFGLTARHIKTSMTMQPSPDACTKQGIDLETDGWYVDLPQFSCPMTASRSPMGHPPQSAGGCQDRVIVRSSGSGRLGFPLQFTQTTKNEGTSFSQTMQTIEFSKAVLEDSLFDIPAGYSQAKSSSDLYGKPDYAAMAKAAQNGAESSKVRSSDPKVPGTSGPAVLPKRPGVKRIGVLSPTNRSEENVSASSLQMFLVQKLTTGNFDAVAVRSEADARAAGCDFLLTSDLSKLKQSTASKIGGMFGKVTNTDTSAARNYDAQVDFRLTSLSNGQTVLQSKASAKSESDSGRAAQGVLAQEAAAVLAAAR